MSSTPEWESERHEGEQKPRIPPRGGSGTLINLPEQDAAKVLAFFKALGSDLAHQDKVLLTRDWMILTMKRS